MAAVDPFWNKVRDAAETVLRHPETELTVQVGDQEASLWAKVNPETKELAVAIEIRRVRKQDAEDGS